MYFKKVEGQSFLTSDLHLNHANIASASTSKWPEGHHRGFNSIEHMNTTIINNINFKVGVDDNLFMLGDFCFGNRGKIPYLRSLINCKNIYWILGNHDRYEPHLEQYFNVITPLLEVNVEDTDLVLCHYSMRIWNGSHKGTYHAYGHSHSSMEHLPHGRSMDVGVDNALKVLGEYAPFSMQEFKNHLKNRSIALLDHHSEKTNVK